MRICGKSYFGLLCVVAFLVVAIQRVDAQPPAPGHAGLLMVEKIPVADILLQLGAKLEGETTAKELDGYLIHFNRADQNQDGKHTKKEYIEKGRYLTPQARAGIFRAADGNSDGVVTRAEYVLNRIITDEGKAIVQGMDDDKDGLVERTEFVKHATKLLSDSKLATQVFSALDMNADGGIPIPEYLRVWGQWARAGRKSAEERIAARRAELANKPDRKPAQIGERRRGGPPIGRPGAGAGPPSVDEVFNRFDANKDGKLQKDEIPEFVRQFILPADTNGDDVVTKKELQSSRQRRRGGFRPRGDPPRGG